MDSNVSDSVKPLSTVLKPSLITSYVTEGICHPIPTMYSKPLLPFIALNEEKPIGKRVGAEVYLMMDPDMVRWQRSLRPLAPSPFFVVDFLASLDDHEVRSIAEKVYTDFSGNGIEVVAIATFLPEIGSTHFLNGSSFHNAKKACIAVANVLKISSAIGDFAKSAPPVVELVCGAMCSSAQKVGARFRMPILNNDEFGHAELLRNLSSAIRKARENCEHLPVIALELEPGPLFWIRDMKSLRILAKRIKDSTDEMIRDYIMFNFDFAHWWIAGIDLVKELANPESNDVMSLVGHVHISGHNKKGHFGDFSLSRVDEETKRTFVGWLAALARDIRKRSPRYSGYVSVEIEAARSPREAVSSVNTLVDWLDKNYF